MIAVLRAGQLRLLMHPKMIMVRSMNRTVSQPSTMMSWMRLWRKRLLHPSLPRLMALANLVANPRPARPRAIKERGDSTSTTDK
jgi:hypothetical protein